MTLVDDDAVFRVSVETNGEVCQARVEHGERVWRFDLDGNAPGMLRTADRTLRFDWEEGSVATRLTLDGRTFPLVVENEAAHRLKSFGLSAVGGQKAHDVRSPMPGLVLQIEVEEGQTVECGQGIAIIEAMKMENEITAPVDGIVVGIAAQSGETVEQSALLCRIEPHPEEAQ